MKFIVGLATGIVIGAAGAVAYSVKSGQDLRETFEGVRSDIQKGDFDALGSRLEKGFNDMQAQLDERIGQIRASTATDTASETLSDVMSDTVPEAVVEAAEQLDVAADEAAEAVSS